jgi:hypothetical protein
MYSRQGTSIAAADRLHCSPLARREAHFANEPTNPPKDPHSPTVSPPARVAIAR